jgi:hypothetical protein
MSEACWGRYAGKLRVLASSSTNTRKDHCSRENTRTHDLQPLLQLPGQVVSQELEDFPFLPPFEMGSLFEADTGCFESSIVMFLEGL